MSTIKVDTIATRTGSGNITLSNNVASLTSAGAISGTNLSASGTLAVTGASTLTGNTAVGGTLTSTGKITSTAGITFGSDTATANVLDDYEEGSWTPAVTVDANTTGTGHYKKIGGVVFLRGYVTGFTNSSNNETLYISGLPFTTANNQAAGSAMWENINNDFKFDIVYVRSSDSRIEFFFSASGSYAELRHIHLDGSNAGVHFNATYLTDQ